MSNPITFAEQIRNAYTAARDMGMSRARRGMHVDAADRLIQAYAFARVLNAYYASRKDGETLATLWATNRNYVRAQADFALMVATNHPGAQLSPNGSAYEAIKHEE